MKRIYSFMFAAVAIFAAASCQKEMANDTFAKSGEKYTFSASIGTETKTILAEGNKINWSVGDNISVFDAEGTAIEFTGQHTIVSTTAQFYADSYNRGEIETAYAIYPDKSSATFDGTTIKELRIAGTQTAVAGSFDPEFAVAVGKETALGSLTFNNVHSLIKFTIGGDTAPGEVVFTNGGMRCIAGRFDYNTTDGTITPWNDGKSITLQPKTGEAFEIGETYYIAFIPGGNLANMTLAFDGTVVKTVTGTKYADASNNYLVNKIINLGTVAFPAAEPEPVVPLEATLIKAFQSHGTTSYMTAWGGTADKDRNIAIDGNYLYIPETQGNAVMWQISLTDGAATQMPVSNVVTSNVTFALSCPRFLKNTDPSVNEGNDVLVVSSMGMNGQETYLYFYKNGLNADPHKVALHNGGNINKRLGDKMSIYGTMQDWAAYYKEQVSSAIINWGGTANVLNVDNIWPVGRTYMDPTSDTDLGGIYFYSKETAGVKGLITTVANGKYGILDNMVTHEGKPVYVAQSWGTDPNLQGCHGFNFFNHNEKDYIAYTSFPEKKLYIIEGAANADGVKAALEAKRVVFEAKIAADDNSCGSGHSAADCSVYQKDGNTYVAGHIQNVGVVVYKLN